ncbi:MAG: discoidin domain-containing protein [Lachnospiraceae bacterium]|nr:discoidin domain-containing protein [Lachnospiraceae bacterium]
MKKLLFGLMITTLAVAGLAGCGEDSSDSWSASGISSEEEMTTEGEEITTERTEESETQDEMTEDEITQENYEKSIYVDYGDTIRVSYQQMIKGATNQDWTDMGETSFEVAYDTFEFQQCDYELSPAELDENVGKAMYKTVGDEFVLEFEGGDGTYSYKYTILEIIKRIYPSGIEASSYLTDDYGTYSADNMIDGDYSTAWADGVSGTGVGETITIHFSEKKLINCIDIVNGYTKDWETYYKNGKVSSVKVDFGNDRVFDYDMSYIDEGDDVSESGDIEEKCLCKITCNEPISTDQITITITGAVAGTKYDDTCISEISVY